ncbi:MAG: FAD-dependent oxidoreductase [Alphaproteobacteria bacterium]|nr:FAD-dependent oxidoreductase [Alphaproteobacteria bacterium]
MSRHDIDIAVIGAGVIGAGCAWQLAKAGLRVALIDRVHPAAGSSGACDGYLSVSTKTPGVAMTLAAASRALYPQWIAALGDLDAETKGGMLVLDQPSQVAAMEAHAAALASVGVHTELLDISAARRLEPALSPALTGAVLCPDECQLNPYKLALRCAEAAAAAGALTLWPAEPVVEDLGADHVRLRLPAQDLTLHARQVVLCGGAASAALGQTFGLTLPVIPRQGVLAVTRRQHALASRFLVAARYLTHKLDPDRASTSTDPLERIGHGFTLESLPTGQHIIGSSRRFVGFDRSAPADVVGLILREAVRYVPALADSAVLRVFAGLRPFVPDKRPFLGRSRTSPAVIVATGHEGDGITLTPITAACVTALATGQTPPVDITTLDPDRFGCQP